MISNLLKKLYQNINHLSGERLGIIKNALSTFSSTHAPQAAASLAYYAIFSLFPLLLVLIAAGSYFLDNEQVYLRVTQIVQTYLPTSPSLITTNLRQVLDTRETVGIIGLLTLLWSASGFFTNLARNINLVWNSAEPRNFLTQRLVGLGMIAGLSGLLGLSLALGWMENLVPFLNVDSASSLSLNLWTLLSKFGSWLIIFLLFLALYYWVPTVSVSWSAAVGGALTASVMWKLSTAAFGWYVGSGLGRYQLVYGSLGAVVALLFLIFIMSMIALFGAHLSAAIEHWKNGKKAEQKRSNTNGHLETNRSNATD